MISNAIWNELAELVFWRLTKLHKPVGGVQFVLFKKINKRLFIPNCTRKSWDYVLIIYMKKKNETA